jgi:F0F1-type ATP synthase assembly protein I
MAIQDMLEKALKNQILRLLVLQYGLGMMYLAVTSLWDLSALMSALTGCLAALLPRTYFCLRMLRFRESDSAEQWLGYAYRSEVGKWVIMGAIFVLAFTTDYPWDPVVLFVGFGVIQVSGWLTPFVIKGN